MNKFRTIIDHPLTLAVLIDVLALALFVIACTLIAETILPGIIYRYISPATLYGIFFTLAALTTVCSRSQRFSFPIQKNRPLAVVIGFLFYIILLAIASVRYGIPIAGAMTCGTAILFAIAYTLYRNMLHRS